MVIPIIKKINDINNNIIYSHKLIHFKIIKNIIAKK